MAGVALVVIWPKCTKISVHYLAVIVDAFAFIMLGFFPKDMNIIVSLYPVFLRQQFSGHHFQVFTDTTAQRYFQRTT